MPALEVSSRGPQLVFTGDSVYVSHSQRLRSSVRKVAGRVVRQPAEESLDANQIREGQ
jgi:hypothetical protein